MEQRLKLIPIEAIVGWQIRNIEMSKIFKARDKEANEAKAKFNIFHKTKPTKESTDNLHDEIKYL